VDPQDPDPPFDQPAPPGTEQPLPPQPPAKRRAWEKPLAIAGIVLGFIYFIIPGFFALRSYDRWRDGKIRRPLFAWIWCGVAAFLLVLSIAGYYAARNQPFLVNDFNDGTGDFVAEGDSFVTLEYVDGGYRFLIKDPSQPQSSRNFFSDSVSFSTVSLEADVTERVGPTTKDEAQGLWCLRSASAGYLFAVGADGSYVIAKQPGASPSTVLTSGTNASAIRGLGQTQRMRLDCRGGGNDPTAVTGFVDGTKVAELRDPEGYDSFNGVGLFVITSEEGTDVLWDNVVARSSIPNAPSQPAGSSSVPTSPTSSASASPSVATSTPAGLNGSWTGTTSQGKPISFTVSDDVVTSLAVRWRHGGASCPLLDSSVEVSQLDIPIVEGVFTILDPSIVGRFESDRRTASGTARFTTNKSGCKAASVTWEAQR